MASELLVDVKLDGVKLLQLLPCFACSTLGFSHERATRLKQKRSLEIYGYLVFSRVMVLIDNGVHIIIL